MEDEDSEEEESPLMGDFLRKDSLFLSKDEIILNVGGRRYTVFRKTISRFPSTRLGKISRLKDVSAMVEHCDGVAANLACPELFFSRSWICFDQILNFHRTGNLHFDAEICALVYKTELGRKKLLTTFT